MGTFLKVFFGVILAALGFFVLVGSAFAAAFAGLDGFTVQFIIALALWADAITFFAKARRWPNEVEKDIYHGKIY